MGISTASVMASAEAFTALKIVGALYLALIALMPFWIIGAFGLGNQFFFGGTSLLIVVGVAMDTMNQIESQLVMRHYDGFMKKGRVRFRGRQRYM